MPTVLIVEDEPSLLESVAFAFEQEGFTVLTAEDGEQARHLFDTRQPDVVVLDLMLPKVSGEELCRYIRARSRVPIVIFSARDSEFDRVLLLELGADDYLTKPFSIRELILRTRKRLEALSADRGEEARLTAGPLVLDPQQHRVYVDSKPVDLTAREFALLRLLMKKPNRVWRRAEILHTIWHDEYVSEKSIDVYVKRLRDKLGPYGSMIKTIRSVGIKLEV
jgi:DNA-binding response OmpR family regulator